MGPAAHPTAQLMQLGDPETVGVEDHHHGGVRHIDADLDHRGCDQHIELTGAEAVHDSFLFRRRQASVQQTERQPIKSPASRRSKVSCALATSNFSLSSINGQTTYAW